MVQIEDNLSRMDQASNSLPQQNKFRSVLLISGTLLAVIAGGLLFVLAGRGQSSVQAPRQSQQPQQTPVDTSSRSNSPNTAPTGERKDIMITGGNYYFRPNELRVKKGDTVKIIFKNDGETHDFVIDALKVKSELVQSGGQTTITFTPTKVGTFEFYCSIGDHRQMGMHGTLRVE